ncbi:hypothetical protein OIU84_018163 [Salix udensis]|uniref:Uncharacterized protein n=1 Tax=Salix udensis TaxID=889485 RepID=A0AAD6PLR2_9ROSI|nr:hypothetical protein OIU84_018163 [Salix udensis]
MSLVTEEIKSKAEVYYGDEMGKEKSQELLKEVGLPNGLLPLHDIIECGIVRETGFVWLKQKKSINHKFREDWEACLLRNRRKMTFKTPSGLFRTFPASAFEVEETGKGAAAKEAMGVSGAVEVKEA